MLNEEPTTHGVKWTTSTHPCRTWAWKGILSLYCPLLERTTIFPRRCLELIAFAAENRNIKMPTTSEDQWPIEIGRIVEYWPVKEILATGVDCRTSGLSRTGLNSTLMAGLDGCTVTFCDMKRSNKLMGGGMVREVRLGGGHSRPWCEANASLSWAGSASGPWVHLVTATSQSPASPAGSKCPDVQSPRPPRVAPEGHADPLC